MDDVIEMNLSQPVEVTTAKRIRAFVRERSEARGTTQPPVELMQFHVLIHCTDGAGQHMVDFVDHRLAPGTAIWIQPGQVQRWSHTHGAFDADVVVFGSSGVPDLPLFSHLFGATAITRLGDDATSVKQLMRWMADDLHANGDLSTAAAVVGVLLRLFARNAVAQEMRRGPRQQLAQLFVQSVDDNIGERSVSWHAQNVGASTRSIARATIDMLGQRPKEVIDARVILQARRRLAWSDDDVATVARSLRFSEASNFTKFFRSRTGQSPSRFRDEVTNLRRI